MYTYIIPIQSLKSRSVLEDGFVLEGKKCVHILLAKFLRIHLVI